MLQPVHLLHGDGDGKGAAAEVRHLLAIRPEADLKGGGIGHGQPDGQHPLRPQAQCVGKGVGQRYLEAASCQGHPGGVGQLLGLQVPAGKGGRGTFR